MQIKDESGDRKYFSQIPHYILNHSTANDQALYLQMKRYAGETGKCFATQETLMNKLGIGKQAFRKSLKYLLEKGWIKYIGMTGGKTRPVKTYAIVDIWKLNILHYEEIGSKTAISFEGGGDTSQNGNMIHPKTAIEEESVNKNIPCTNVQGAPLMRSNSFSIKGKRNKNIEKVISYFRGKMGGSPDGSAEQNRRYAMHLLNKFRKDFPDKSSVDLVCRLMDIALADKYHGPRATSFKYLYYNTQQIIQSIKKKIQDPKFIQL